MLILYDPQAIKKIQTKFLHVLVIKFFFFHFIISVYFLTKTTATSYFVILRVKIQHFYMKLSLIFMLPYVTQTWDFTVFQVCSEICQNFHFIKQLNADIKRNNLYSMFKLQTLAFTRYLYFCEGGRVGWWIHKK